MKPRSFGTKPILMMRWDGGLRIINPNGVVEWTPFNDPARSDFDPADGCTNRANQEWAYKACVRYDKKWSKMNQKFPNSVQNYSKFLGYL